MFKFYHYLLTMAGYKLDPMYKSQQPKILTILNRMDVNPNDFAFFVWDSRLLKSFIFGFGRKAVIVISRGTLEFNRLTEKSIEHELRHYKNRHLFRHVIAGVLMRIGKIGQRINNKIENEAWQND